MAVACTVCLVPWQDKWRNVNPHAKKKGPAMPRGSVLDPESLGRSLKTVIVCDPLGREVRALSLLCRSRCISSAVLALPLCPDLKLMSVPWWVVAEWFVAVSWWVIAKRFVAVSWWVIAERFVAVSWWVVAELGGLLLSGSWLYVLVCGACPAGRFDQRVVVVVLGLLRQDFEPVWRGGWIRGRAVLWLRSIRHCTYEGTMPILCHGGPVVPLPSVEEERQSRISTDTHTDTN